MTLFAFFGGQLGFWEILIIAIAGVVLFGRRLPEVGRYLGKGIIEFKKGLKGIEDDVETASANQHAAPYQQVEAPRPPQRITPAAPKFQDRPVDSEGTARYQG